MPRDYILGDGEPRAGPAEPFAPAVRSLPERKGELRYLAARDAGAVIPDPEDEEGAPVLSVRFDFPRKGVERRAAGAGPLASSISPRVTRPASQPPAPRTGSSLPAAVSPTVTR